MDQHEIITRNERLQDTSKDMLTPARHRRARRAPVERERLLWPQNGQRTNINELLIDLYAVQKTL